MQRPLTTRIGWFCLVMIIAGVAAHARAATFNVSPVRIHLSAAKMTGVLSVTNAGEAPTVVQCQVRAWSQQNEKDVYATTDDLIATPPIFTIGPGKTQIVRLGLRQPPHGSQEAAYRIYLQEIPGPPKPGFQGLQIALRIGVPIFVDPARAVAPALHWQAKLGEGGSLSLALQNAGNAHIQVFDFSISRPGTSQPIAAEKVSAYVLPAHSMHWSLKPSQKGLKAGQTLHLKAYTDAGDVDTDLVLGSP